MRTSLYPLGALLLSVGLVAGAADPGAADSSAPVTYVLDYGGQHLGNAAWLAATVSAPPQLLHLGKDVVMTHNWGPIVALGGENQAYGKGASVRRLSPAETRERMAGLRAMVSALHAGGVTMVMPYICAMTIGGHPERRTGFWEFYDHWDEYREFGLGARPAADPATWLQVNPDGSPHFYYGLTDGGYPPYAPNIRYACCMNNPNWRSWSEQVVRLCAEVGYDGVFVDNGGSQRCYCAFCRDKFRAFLSARYQPPAMEQLFGTSRVADLALATDAKQGLLWVETQRFWMATLREHHLALRAAGERVKQPFYVFPNGGEGRPEHVKLTYAPVDYVMYEKSIGEFGTNPGLARRRIVRPISLTHYNDNIYENKLTASVGGREKPIILSRGGYPRTNPDWDMNPQSAELGMAEMAAFGNGGGFLVRPEYNTFGAALRKYRQFFTEHADLYSAAVPYARVAVACFPEQKLYGNAAHIERLRSVTRALADCHLLFNYVLEEQFTPGALARYGLVIMPTVRVMTREQVSALTGYLRHGGRVLFIGENGLQDERLQPFAEPPLPAAAPDNQAAPAGVGEGRYVARTTVPNPSALWDLLGQLEGRGLALMPPDRDGRVCFNATSAPSGAVLYLHVVNYAVPLGWRGGEVPIRTGLQVRLPLPEGTRAAQATVYDPDATGPQTAPCKLDAGALEVALPALRIYQVVKVDLKPSP